MWDCFDPLYISSSDFSVVPPAKHTPGIKWAPH